MELHRRLAGGGVGGVGLPAGGGELGAGEHPARPGHEGEEDVELGPGEPDRRAGPHGLARGGVEDDVAPGDDPRRPAAPGGGPPQQRANPLEDHGQREGLGDEVVGEKGEGAELVVLPVEGGEDHDGDVGGGPDRLAEREAVDLGHHHVQHDEVEGLRPERRLERAEAREPVRLPARLVARVREQLHERVQNVWLVLDHEHPLRHGRHPFLVRPRGNHTARALAYG